MTSKETKKRDEDEFNKRREAERIEFVRKDQLSMWQRIEEANTIDDVKDILHRMAETLKLE